MFPDWVHGCQMVQIALWMWAGISKIGPWFSEVLPFLVKESLWSLLLPEGALGKALYRGLPTECGPSRLARVLAAFGVVLEFMLPALLFAPSTVLNQIGCYGMMSYHLVIISCVPFASVFEWNYYCVFITIALFRERGAAILPTSPGLLGLLAVVSVIIPAIGQAVPSLVPFLIAYRPYMGNWRMSWIVIHNSALPKHRKLKTWASPLEVEQAQPYARFMRQQGWQGAAMMEQVNYFVLGLLLFAPSLRLTVPVVEALLKERNWDVDDITIGFSETWQNQVFGWSLGTGWLQTRECFREALVDCCGFNEGEMYLIQIEPASPLNRKVFYRCMDVAKGPLDTTIHGAVPFSQLSDSKAFADLKLTPEQMQHGGKSIRGTFLDTYYVY